jgi:hypothetical protein
MVEDKGSKQSRLIGILREGISVIQMIFFKEIRLRLQGSYPDTDPKTLSKLAGAITNELFGTPNPEPEFVLFLQEHQSTIEQEMLGLAVNLPHLRRPVTDALRIEALCDNQEGRDQANSLVIAEKIGLLLKDREVPLPSTFMTMVREIGGQHQLIVPPVPISADDDKSIAH